MKWYKMVIINIVMICIILYHHGGILATMTLSVTWIYQCNSMYIIFHSSEMYRASYGHDSRVRENSDVAIFWPWDIMTNWVNIPYFNWSHILLAIHNFGWILRFVQEPLRLRPIPVWVIRRLRNPPNIEGERFGNPWSYCRILSPCILCTLYRIANI